jgi:hypothetical protein
MVNNVKDELLNRTLLIVFESAEIGLILLDWGL